MEKFTTIISTAIPLPVENIDTDQIIPARFLKATTREGFGNNLFRDWRYDNNNNPIHDFILNNNQFKGSILIAGKNFGCGSSREHAAWALYDFGFRVVISSYFADIFKNNALNNGILPIQVSQIFLNQLLIEVTKKPELIIKIDLQNQEVIVNNQPEKESFEINPYKKLCLINGYDDIDYLLNLKKEIEEYEKTSKYLSLF